MTVLLDTNFLIASLTPGTPQDGQLQRWLAAGESVRVSSIVWFEFLCGPPGGVTPEQVRLAITIVGEPEALLPTDAARAAELFNLTGRRRGSLADCLIAATVLRLDASLATENMDDFNRFAPMGLQVISAA